MNEHEQFKAMLDRASVSYQEYDGETWNGERYIKAHTIMIMSTITKKPLSIFEFDAKTGALVSTG